MKYAVPFPKSLRAVWWAMRYDSTLPTRVMLAIAAAIFAISMLLAPDQLGAGEVYKPLFELMPRGAWVALYMVDAVALIWRIIDQVPRPWWSRLTLGATSSLWAVNVVFATVAYGYLTPGYSAEISLMLISMWATIRTELTPEDRQSA